MRLEQHASQYFYVDLQHALRQKQFFIFDGGTKPYKLSMGAVRGSRFRVAGGFALDGFSSKLTVRPFIHGLCPIYETMFNLPLFAYITSLKVFHYQSSPASRDWKRKSLDGCDSNQAPKSTEALEKSQAAEIQCRSGTDCVDTLLIDTWDDGEVTEV